MIFALYDDDDNILGCYSRKELEILLNTSRRSFHCIISRILNGHTKAINYDGKRYNVYVYEGSDSNE